MDPRGTWSQSRNSTGTVPSGVDQLVGAKNRQWDTVAVRGEQAFEQVLPLVGVGKLLKNVHLSGAGGRLVPSFDVPCRHRKLWGLARGAESTDGSNFYRASSRDGEATESASTAMHRISPSSSGMARHMQMILVLADDSGRQMSNRSRTEVMAGSPSATDWKSVAPSVGRRMSGGAHTG